MVFLLGGEDQGNRLRVLVLEQAGNHARVHFGDGFQWPPLDPGRNLVEQLLGTLVIGATENGMLGELFATDVDTDIATARLFELFENLAGDSRIDVLDIHHAAADFADFAVIEGFKDLRRGFLTKAEQ